MKLPIFTTINKVDDERHILSKYFYEVRILPFSDRHFGYYNKNEWTYNALQSYQCCDEGLDLKEVHMVDDMQDQQPRLDMTTFLYYRILPSMLRTYQSCSRDLLLMRGLIEPFLIKARHSQWLTGIFVVYIQMWFAAIRTSTLVAHWKSNCTFRTELGVKRL